MSSNKYCITQRVASEWERILNETNPTDDYLAAMKDLVTEEMLLGFNPVDRPPVVVFLGEYVPHVSGNFEGWVIAIGDQWIHKWREEHGLS